MSAFVFGMLFAALVWLFVASMLVLWRRFLVFRAGALNPPRWQVLSAER